MALLWIHLQNSSAAGLLREFADSFTGAGSAGSRPPITEETAFRRVPSSTAPSDVFTVSRDLFPPVQWLMSSVFSAHPNLENE